MTEYDLYGNEIPAAPERNGHGAAPAADWRQAAMDEAIHCRARDGSPQFAVLRALTRRLPGYTAQLLWEDRNRLLDVLGKRLPDLAPVVPPAYCRDSENVLVSVLGWWRGTDPADGRAYELVLAPDESGYGDWILAGPDREALLALAAQAIDESRRNLFRCRRFTNGSWSDSPEMVAEVERVGWDDIVLPDSLAADLRRNVDAFFTQRELFRRLGFAWRRGILLVGPPGTGKTMVCKAVAGAHPNIPFLYVRDVETASRRRDDLSAIFAEARRSAPCILAFEDIDGLVGDQNRAALLNELDGFRGNDGLLVIASSNHPERIDEALLKRPSRFDRVYHIGLPALAERVEHSRRLLARLPNVAGTLDGDALVRSIAESTEGFTPAFLKEAFLSAALQMAQDGIETLDERFAAAVREQVEALRKYLKKAKDPTALADILGTGGEIGFRAR